MAFSDNTRFLGVVTRAPIQRLSSWGEPLIPVMDVEGRYLDNYVSKKPTYEKEFSSVVNRARTHVEYGGEARMAQESSTLSGSATRGLSGAFTFGRMEFGGQRSYRNTYGRGTGARSWWNLFGSLFNRPYSGHQQGTLGAIRLANPRRYTSQGYIPVRYNRPQRRIREYAGVYRPRPLGA